MEALAAHVAAWNAKPLLAEVKEVRFDRDTKNLIFSLAFPAPHNVVTVRLTPAYLSNYPNGAVSMMVGDDFHIVPVSAATVERLAFHVCELCKAALRTPPTMTTATGMDGGEGAGGMFPSGSWTMEPTTEFFGADGQGSCIHRNIAADVTTVDPFRVIIQDQPAIGKCLISVFVSIEGKIGKATCTAWQLSAEEPLEIRLTVDRMAYLDAPVKVEVGQCAHFLNGVALGAAGQLQRIVQTFCDTCRKAVVNPDRAPLQQLVDAGFDEVVARKALLVARDDVSVASAILTGESEEWLSLGKPGDRPEGDAARGSAVEKKLPPPRVKGFIHQVASLVAKRLLSLPEFCVVCDRPHVFATGMMLQPSVCSREMCVFRFQRLGVGRMAASSIAVQTNVIDLLMNVAIAAARSTRWDLIFNPFPTIYREGSAEGEPPIVSDSNRNIDVVRAICDKLPQMKTIAGSDSASELEERLRKAHEHALPFFRWVMSSNKSFMLKIPPGSKIPFMGTDHQFLLFTAPPEHQEKFAMLKKKHGALWAFHGSRAENWHSILRNGLKNASGTKFQLNGTAYGNGIYLSPSASVSFGYSQINNNTNPGRSIDQYTSSFIDLGSMLAIAICEVVNFELKQSGNIWVQPHEHCVITRFLFVYQHGMSAGGSTELTDKANTAVLEEALKTLA